MLGLRNTVIFIAILLLASAGFAAEAEKKAAPQPEQKSHWVDLKKEAKQVVPNIPAEYEGLVKVFNEYWDAAKKNDVEKAYQMESSEYRKKVSLEKYKDEKVNKPGKAAVTTTSVRAIGVKKLNEKEVVVEAILALKTGMSDNIRPLKDYWVLEQEAGWKHKPSH